MYRNQSASGGSRRTTSAYSLESQVARIIYIFSTIALRWTGDRPAWRNVRADLQLAVGYPRGIKTIELIAVDSANRVVARWSTRFGVNVGKAYVNEPTLSEPVRRQLRRCNFHVIVDWGDDKKKFQHRLRAGWSTQTAKDTDLRRATVTKERNSVWCDGERVHVSSSHVKRFGLRPGWVVAGTVHTETGGRVFNVASVISR